jgi:hypothetical protein
MDINDDTFLSHLVHLSENEALNFVAANVPMGMRSDLLQLAAKHRRLQRKASKRAKLTTVYHAELWHRLIAPLKYELSNAKVGLRLKTFEEAPERHTAFTEYITLLEKLLAGLQKMQLEEGAKASVSMFMREQQLDKQERLQQIEYAKTPSELAAERGLPNKGVHWTDWIAERTKNRIRVLFDAIPQTLKAKRPNPFSYRIPPDLFKRDIEALQKRTIHEIENMRQEIEMLSTVDKPLPEHTAKLNKLKDNYDMAQVALEKTMRMRNEPVPATWQGVHVTPDDVWPGGDTDAEAWLRLSLKMNTPEPTKKRTNRPKRYRK